MIAKHIELFQAVADLHLPEQDSPIFQEFRQHLNAAEKFCPSHIEARMSQPVHRCDVKMRKAAAACRDALEARQAALKAAEEVDQYIADLRELVREDGVA